MNAGRRAGDTRARLLRRSAAAVALPGAQRHPAAPFYAPRIDSDERHHRRDGPDLLGARLPRDAAHAAALGSQRQHRLQHARMPRVLSLRDGACAAAGVAGDGPLHGSGGGCSAERREHLAHLWSQHYGRDA